ncbi:hypothetical protein MPSEU_000041400 [Mayamaea pseudoterrestris]|nr:hypothetical protein MPSEU_000041400 [Mayamaea pseudoterrestris]
MPHRSRLQSRSSDTEDEDRLSDGARKLHRYIRKLKWTSLSETLELLRSEGDEISIRTALTQCNRFGESPLHAISKDAPNSLIIEMLSLVPANERPDYLMAVDNNGNTPLHSLCRHMVSETDIHIVHNLATWCPQAMGVRNHQGDTPLHLFVRSDGYLDCENVRVVETARVRLQRGTGPLGLYGC